jgi:uncharacterized membrane protein
VLGNLVPVVFMLHFLGPLERRLRFIRVFDQFFDHLFHRTHRKHSDRIDRYGALGLATFVAIPLPVTGAWTGVAAAYVFEIQNRYAFPAIVLGVLLAGVIVTRSNRYTSHTRSGQRNIELRPKNFTFSDFPES